ncbi:hypothetical protein [Streptomyces lanatus]|uniref:Secreted protein n=1 Tax=Streptomyces lanatus TaxID=66900 RepID=A0ABV1Y5X5_9ACTN|nr:hypothetical protein [Streptomyces lanatus]GHH29699.1 hypothetical protein GCM10018780_88140 [Streptomyces lanatus]
MRTRSILAAVALTTAILAGGTGIAVAQAQPLPDEGCLLGGLGALAGVGYVSGLGAVAVQDIPVFSREQFVGEEPQSNPCSTIANSGQLL